MPQSSTPPYQPLTPARPAADARGVPFSEQYGDVYHAAAGAFEQAGYVFLQGNGLPMRWHAREHFTVCETGFGLGLNFLALWRAWRGDPSRPRRLHMVSFEAHPLWRADLQRLLDALVPGDEMRALARQLAAQWPPLLPGVHRLDFEGGRVSLTVAFGDAQAMVERLSFQADAFFLDGFAPDRNPAMWTPALMRALAGHAASDATVATWCSAGEVRRGLQEAGFAVQKRRGFAGKTHMTVGARTGAAAAALAPPPHVLVVGGGLAGAGIAHALALRGVQVMLADPRYAPGATAVHAGHAAAALTPLVARDDNPRARLSRAGSLRAAARWSGLPAAAAPWRRGTLQLPRDAGRAADAASTLAALDFPRDWVRQVDAAEACAIAGVPVSRGGVFFADGMLVRPQPLIDVLCTHPGITRVAACVHRLSRDGAGWHAHTDAGGELQAAPAVVLANAIGTPSVLSASSLLDAVPRIAQMHALAGEVTLLPADVLQGGPRCIVGGEGYLLPAVDGWCVSGSTYAHGAAHSLVGPEGQAVNIGKAAGLLAPELAHMLAGLPAGALPGWAGWRAVMPGRLPAIGELPQAPGVYVATGYASRGLSWCALAGDIIAARLCGEPLPLETDLLAAIAPR